MQLIFDASVEDLECEFAETVKNDLITDGYCNGIFIFCFCWDVTGLQFYGCYTWYLSLELQLGLVIFVGEPEYEIFSSEVPVELLICSYTSASIVGIFAKSIHHFHWIFVALNYEGCYQMFFVFRVGLWSF